MTNPLNEMDKRFLKVSGDVGYLSKTYLGRVEGGEVGYGRFRRIERDKKLASPHIVPMCGETTGIRGRTTFTCTYVGSKYSNLLESQVKSNTTQTSSNVQSPFQKKLFVLSCEYLYFNSCLYL